jgi:SAM-dependent methyltransferase
MDDTTPTELFFELFSGLPRQGPGDPASTRRALSLVPALGPDARILDIGCGTGAATLELARATPAAIAAVDFHRPFVDALDEEVRALGFADRVRGLVGDMTSLEFPDGHFDLLWCEGAIFVIGLETGLRAWRRLLRPGGHLAFTDACWLRPDVPAECVDFWMAEYPAIRDVPAMRGAIGAAGYELVDDFALPSSSWWDDYYVPLERRLTAFRARHDGEPRAEAVASQAEREIDVFRRYSDYYGYVFFVLRRPLG